MKYTHQDKRKRNQRLYDYRQSHPDWSLKAIAKVFHISTARVSQILKAREG